MDCKSEESAQRAESLVLQGQEGIPGDGGEDGLSEIFQLLQMDVEYEHQEDGACPANSTCPQHSKRFLKALTKEKLLEAKHSGPRLCVDLSMTHQMSKKVEYSDPKGGMEESGLCEVGDHRQLLWHSSDLEVSGFLFEATKFHSDCWKGACSLSSLLRLSLWP
ncbi:tRNA methyltransferase 10B [Cricetulus griseus]